MPPSLLATALLLQTYDRVSDEEAKERADYLSKKALAATDEVTSGSGFFKSAFDEAYLDVREDQALSTLFASNGVHD